MILRNTSKLSVCFSGIADLLSFLYFGRKNISVAKSSLDINHVLPRLPFAPVSSQVAHRSNRPCQPAHAKSFKCYADHFIDTSVATVKEKKLVSV